MGYAVQRKALDPVFTFAFSYKKRSEKQRSLEGLSMSKIVPLKAFLNFYEKGI